ncbi:AraC family transcriptional regulator [Paenibacillus gansuensis]|uniref:Helix-turn-helix domain-containing protein n=1 Tax=Paenibacillus gansuensis TaxID=306542 RepID=A0ABW5PEU1_9BACL
MRQYFLMPAPGEQCYIGYFGQEACSPGHYAGPHVRDHYLWVYVASGRGAYEAPGISREVKQGQSFLLHPHVMTKWQADDKHPWEYMWISVEGNRAGERMEQLGFRAEEPILNHKRPERVLQLLSMLLQENPTGGREERALFYQGLLLLIQDELVRDLSAAEPAFPSRDESAMRMQKAKEFLDQHYDKPIQVSQAADYVGLERSYFTKLFKKHIGLSPYVYLLELRLSKAKQLLEQTDQPVEHIALMLGFADAFHFSAFFKRKTGSSPRYYRKWR